MKKLVLIDGHAVFHRAYHALPPLTTSKGELVNAVFGFTSMLLRAISDIKPNYIVVAFDTAAPTFRHQEYTLYKAQRIAAPQELHEQLPRVKQVVETLNIPIFELAGYEADDIIGTLVAQSSNLKSQSEDLEVIIVTGDRDTLQLVSPKVKVCAPGKSFSDVIYYDEKRVREKYGLDPSQLVDYKALAGDPSDNIPGVRGIGDVTATKLLQEFGNIEKLYHNLDKVKNERIRKMLEADAESAVLSKKLATIDTKVPIKLNLKEGVLSDYNKTAVTALFEELEFKSLIPKLPGSSKKIPKSKPFVPNEQQIGFFDGSKEQSIAVNEKTRELEKVLRETEDRGVLIDKEFLSELSVDINTQLEELEDKIYSSVGHEFNLNSPKQLSSVLYQELNLANSAVKKRKTHLATDEATLLLLLGSHPVIELMLNYRELFKLKSTYIDSLPSQIGDDGRIHTHYHTDVTRTGRLSSKNPNLQNIPIRGDWGEKIRKIFIAPRNHLILSADYNQIELRVMAHMSQDENLKEIFKRGEDAHTKTASQIFGKEVTTVSNDERRIAKMVNFGIMYGISPFGLARELQIDYEKAKEIIERYFEEFPRVKLWIGDTLREAYEKGFVETLGGFRRYVLELKSNNRIIRGAGERSAVNSPVQGTAADIIKEAMVKLNEELRIKNLETKMILQVHDELVFEVPEKELKKAAPMVKSVMETAFPLSVPLVVDLKIGKNWGEMKPYAGITRGSNNCRRS